MDTGKLTDLTASTAVAAMRKGEIKAETYAQALLDRARALAGLNAFRSMNRELVLEAANAADKRRADALPGRDRELLSLGLSLENALGPIPPPSLPK